MAKKRYAIVGTGGRTVMFLEPLATRFKEDGELVGMCDINPGRLEYYSKQLTEKFSHPTVATYLAGDFDKMVKQTRPDAIIVATVDAFHHQYIIRAMELGCDVITEKPMTIDAPKCRAIYDAIERTGRQLRVCFNYRWTPGTTLVRQLLAEQTIGQILHVDMQYLLDTSHGADYFRRWHRDKSNSGGLLVHKSTHHFDLVNWWIDAVPQTVFAMGRLAFYGRENAEKRGVKVEYDRYTGHDTQGDPFALDLAARDGTRQLYLEQEKHDGYRRDQNVFGDNISIEDTMSVMVRYRTDVVLNYSLNAYLPREGYHVAFNGTKGRIEYQEIHNSHIIAGPSNEELANEMQWHSQLVVHPMFAKAYKVEIPEGEGGHGGGDPMLQEQIFSRQPPAETLGRNAGHGQGAASILIGAAANQSMASGQPVRIEDLCPQLGNAKQLSALP